jgi:hypothetical protein
VALSVEELIRRELELLAPREDAGGADWHEVRRRAGIPIPDSGTISPRQPHRVRRGALVFSLVVLLAAAVAVPSLGLGSDLRDLLGLSNAPPKPLFDKARLLVEAPADKGEMARLYEAPSSAGGTCWFVDRVPIGSPAPTVDSDGGGMCQVGDSATPPDREVPITWSVGMQPKTRNNTQGWRAPILDGWVNPELGATRVVLKWTGGSVELPFANDHFLFVSESLYEPAGKNLPYELIAYDAAGAEVARTRIFKTALYVP